MQDTELIIALLVLVFVVLNLVLLIIIRRFSVRIGENPPGLHIHKLMRYVHTQSQYPSGQKLKPWIRTYFITNAIGFITIITLCALL